MFACSTFIYWMSSTSLSLRSKIFIGSEEWSLSPWTHTILSLYLEILKRFIVDKVCFLLLFYDMLTRLRRLILAWKIIFGMTVLFWALCTCAIFFNCPHFAKTTTKSAIPLQSNSVPHWLQYLITRRTVFRTSRVYSSEHHMICSRYRVEHAP